MIIDSHMHLIRVKNFDANTYEAVGMSLPSDTDLDTLVGWYKEAGINRCVCMGQDMSRIWNTTFGEEYIHEASQRYPDFFIPFVSLEPLDKANRFNRKAYEYFDRSITEDKIKGVLLTPPYGQYKSNDKTAYPFYELAERKGIVVQYHHSAQMGPAVLAPTKYAKMENLNDVIMDFPEMKIVVEHLGYPWSEYLFVLMTNCKTMYTDLAMTYHRPLWLARQILLAREYGVLDRVMFATDYVSYNYDVFHENPVEDLKRWIDFVKNGLNKINKHYGWPLLTQDEIDNILFKTASKLYTIRVLNHFEQCCK
jgi:predicted TIM-barrel fold metal-dependent hydrolase